MMRETASSDASSRSGSTIGSALVEYLRPHRDILRLSLAGSLRRRKEVVKDIDLVASVRRSGPVMKAFLASPDDVIVEIEGEAIRSSGRFRKALREFQVGDTVEITYWRKGKKKTVEVEVAAKPARRQ